MSIALVFGMADFSRTFMGRGVGANIKSNGSWIQVTGLLPPDQVNGGEI